MGTGNNGVRYRWLLTLAAATCLVVSGSLVWAEAEYLVSGRDAQAKAVRGTKGKDRGWLGLGGWLQTIEYVFTEPDGTRRKGSDTVSDEWLVPADGTVAVRYGPGAGGRSRLAGHVDWVGLGLGFALLGLAVGSAGAVGYWQWRSRRHA